MQVRKTFKAESRKDYGCDVELNSGLTNDSLKTGCLMRIADATETMARRYQDLIDERDRYKRWYGEEKTARQQLLRRFFALKGVITKLRKAKP